MLMILLHTTKYPSINTDHRWKLGVLGGLTPEKPTTDPSKCENIVLKLTNCLRICVRKTKLT